MMKRRYDVVVIGGGVVGCLISRALSRYKLSVLILEKEADVCEGASKANTAIVHAGYDPKPGTLKASLNVEGNRMFPQLASELGVPYERRGTYVLAFSSEEMGTLEELKRRGVENGVIGLEIISGDEMRRLEPEVNPSVKGALYAPNGGIVDPFILTIAAAENAIANGIELLLETEALDFIKEGNRIVGVITKRGTFRCDWVINAAGLFADELMKKAGLEGFEITPRRGEYCVFDKEKSVVRNVLFPCPTPISKGILVTPTIHGNTLIGPNAQDIEEKEDKAVTSSGLEEVFSGAKRLVPSLDKRDVIAIYAGLRASGSTGDFLIEAPCEVRGLVNVAGIESPGLTAAPAIAEYVINILREEGLRLEEKEDYNPIRPPRPRFSQLSRREQEDLIEKDPRYARIVCRCEMVTEGEIVAAIRSPLPARTYDAVKRRTRCGTGRCQGGFDTPRVVKILARELGISPKEVTKKGEGSEFLKRKTKFDVFPHKL
jgi:glycerol-3-phosphate dehydrogenase